MNVEKYIQGIKSKVQAKIDKLYAEANEAFSDWAVTGYQRYITKKERLENEAAKLEAFINPNLEIRSAWAKANEEEQKKERLKLLMKRVQNVVEDEMKYDFPDSHATRRLQSIVEEFKYDLANK